MIHRVYAQIKPSKGNDPGQVSEGYYTIADGVLTMTRPDGEPVKNPAEHTLYQHRLGPNDSPDVIAVVLTKKVRLHMKGIFTDESTSFNRTLEYRSEGIA